MTPQQKEELQNAIILACHPGLTLQEAKEKELGFGCMIERYIGQTEYIYKLEKSDNSIYYATVDLEMRVFEERTTYDNFGKINIIGMPATLARVMECLNIYNPNTDGYNWCGSIKNSFRKSEYYKYIFLEGCIYKVKVFDSSTKIIEPDGEEVIRTMSGDYNIQIVNKVCYFDNHKTLFEQSEETQMALYNIICKK